jgi:hypothetical protein
LPLEKVSCKDFCRVELLSPGKRLNVASRYHAKKYQPTREMTSGKYPLVYFANCLLLYHSNPQLLIRNISINIPGVISD